MKKFSNDWESGTSTAGKHWINNNFNLRNIINNYTWSKYLKKIYYKISVYFYTKIHIKIFKVNKYTQESK